MPNYGAEIGEFKRFPSPRKPLKSLSYPNVSNCATFADVKHLRQKTQILRAKLGKRRIILVDG
jgi:hypothetical protein